jgi:hypothetical protein
MDNIVEPNETFDFNQLTLAHPSGIQGGAYFTKIEYNKKPLYIQTTKGQTRQGFVKTGKKYYCDLMFDKNSETLLNWFENLEERCQNLLYDKRYEWFQNNLEKNDIETAFNSSIRIYKSGKFYLIRTNIKSTRTDEPAVKIYNENEVVLDMSHITSETNIVSILEIQGIKFTSRNFQIEIELKQVMVLNNEPIFNSCLIKTSKPKNQPDNLFETKPLEKKPQEPNNSLGNILVDNSLDIILDNDLVDNSLKNDLAIDVLDNTNFTNDLAIDIKGGLNNILVVDAEKHKDEEKLEETNIELDFEDLDETNNDDTDELKEVNLNTNLETLESIQLKKPNQVYFELYVEARKKAKEAKKNAILAYLEVKNIKKTYMIDNTIDSDSDFDAEIDEVSESELDNFL